MMFCTEFRQAWVFWQSQKIQIHLSDDESSWEGVDQFEQEKLSKGSFRRKEVEVLLSCYEINHTFLKDNRIVPN